MDVGKPSDPSGLWLAFLVPPTRLGPYLSEIAHFVPCVLCWYQRIAMYLLLMIFCLTAVEGRRGGSAYAVVGAIGAAISIYHYQLERFPDSGVGLVQPEAPCTVVIWKFHFISIRSWRSAGSR